MPNKIILAINIVLVATLPFVLTSCGTAPGDKAEVELVKKAIEEGTDPLDAIYKANMTPTANKKTVARMMLELVKQLRSQNQILEEIRDELVLLRELRSEEQ